MQVKNNIRQLQESFNDLLDIAQEALLSQPNIVDKVRLRLTSFCVDVEENIPLFDEMMRTLLTKMDIPDILILMTRNRVWDPINIRILVAILKKCLPTDYEVHGHFEKYSDEVQKFQRKTLLNDYITIIGTSRSYPHGCTTITAKFERKYREYTMKEFAEDQKFLAGEFLLHQSVLRFKDSQCGCVSITWFIPRTALILFEPPKINKKRKALSDKGVIEIIVDEKYIYRVSIICTCTTYYSFHFSL